MSNTADAVNTATDTAGVTGIVNPANTTGAAGTADAAGVAGTAAAAGVATTEREPSRSDNKWDNEAHMVLCGALCVALNNAGSTPAAHKQQIQAALLANGYSFSWEGIR